MLTRFHVERLIHSRATFFLAWALSLLIFIHLQGHYVVAVLAYTTPAIFYLLAERKDYFEFKWYSFWMLCFVLLLQMVSQTSLAFMVANGPALILVFYSLFTEKVNEKPLAYYAVAYNFLSLFIVHALFI
jgi:hypothetical protein